MTLAKKPCVLLTASGKRVQLIDALRRDLRVACCDCSDMVASRHFADSFKVVPSCDDPGYVDALLDICAAESADFLIPLFEPEFDGVSSRRGDFERAGTVVLLSDPEVLLICGDKRETAAFAARHSIPAPGTLAAGEARAGDFPLIVKPASGMGSDGVHVAADLEELAFYASRTEEPVVQRLAPGVEYTVDVLCDLDGGVLCAVPRIRQQVRAGEVVKSRVSMNARVLELAGRTVECLASEGAVRGPLTIQCFHDEGSDEALLIEVNPRLGGGVPLALEAGAPYGAMLGALAAGARPDPVSDFRELSMVRFDRAVFFEGGEAVGVR